jgi:hypothetical protein
MSYQFFCGAVSWSSFLSRVSNPETGARPETSAEHVPNAGAVAEALKSVGEHRAV